jgi:GNAT superfamily N-acetyltransferase
MTDGYPAELECRVAVGDGLVVRLRPIRPADGGRLVEFHGKLSPRSVYRRYFFLHPNLSDAEVERLTHVDYVDRLALIAEAEGEIVAVGRYDRSPGSDEAEVAFVVADEYQHHGIGTLLLERLAAAAWENGVTTFVAQTLRENRAMLDVFHGSGFPVTSTSEYDTVRVRFPIEPDDAYRSEVAARHAEGSSARPTS